MYKRCYFNELTDQKQCFYGKTIKIKYGKS